MTWADILIGICVGVFFFGLIPFISWIANRLNPTIPYKGLYGDGRKPEELTKKELHQALSKEKNRLNEWHAVITELVIRNKQ